MPPPGPHVIATVPIPCRAPAASRLVIGLVQQPKAGIHGQDAGHGDAAALTGRQHPCRQIRTSGGTRALQAGAQFQVRDPPFQSHGKAQVLQRRQIALQRRLVRGIGKRRLILVADARDGLPRQATCLAPAGAGRKSHAAKSSCPRRSGPEICSSCAGRSATLTPLSTWRSPRHTWTSSTRRPSCRRIHSAGSLAKSKS